MEEVAKFFEEKAKESNKGLYKAFLENGKWVQPGGSPDFSQGIKFTEVDKKASNKPIIRIRHPVAGPIEIDQPNGSPCLETTKKFSMKYLK